MSTTPRSQESGLGGVAWVVLVAAFGGFLFGFDTAVINGAVGPIQDQFSLSDLAIGFTVSSALLGCMVGAWAGGSLSDRIGRQRAMMVAAALFFISAIGSGLAFGAADLVLWRVLGGIGVGMASVIAPSYIAEVAPTHLRGRLGSTWQLAIVVGIFMAAASNAFIANLAGGAAEELWFGLEAWRWMFLLEAGPALLYALLASSIPESPRYLVSRGRDKQAAKVLQEIVGIQGEAAIAQKIKDVRETINMEARQRFRDLIVGGRLTPIVWVGLGLAVFQQFVGINVIFYYSNTLWQAVGIAEDQAFLVQIITTSVNIVATVIGIIIVDRVGRRIPLAVGSAGMAAGLGMMAVAFSQAIITVGADGEELVSLPGAWGMIALVSANVFVLFFGATWGPFMWVLLGEMFPNRVRAVALGVTASANWAANFLISMLFPEMAAFSLVFAYGFYAASALLSMFFVLKWVPETKGRELEDMSDAAYEKTPRVAKTR
ncbi:sugar porter family MFS transporter [Nesterenkonia sandarakina]|uniref:Sugar porter (SP) family MFS transporter n=1 Tax=Nesterenkonia sandarakina TaxID=272918 RepID=A0A7Z0E763_9MICC|nr:sugar porter family MFS transporter [Nesterenkonia sandarakina]NYJ15880.1 sugar porter (SP) family MFS transporter [Nesterenkonia sandarakina]